MIKIVMRHHSKSVILQINLMLTMLPSAVKTYQSAGNLHQFGEWCKQSTSALVKIWNTPT